MAFSITSVALQYNSLAAAAVCGGGSSRTMAALLRLVCVFVLVAHAAAAGTTPCNGDCGPSDFPPRGVPSDRPLRRLEREYCINHTTCEACVSEEGCGWCNDGVNHTTGCVADDMASTCGWFDPNTCKLPELPAPVTPPDEEPVAIPKPKEEAMDPYMLRKRAKFTPPPACNPWYHVACIKSAMAGYTQFKIKPAPDHCTEYQSCSSCLA